MRTSESLTNIMPAFAKAQAALGTVEKKKTAEIRSSKGSYTFTYADIADVLEAIKPTLKEHELAIMQDVANAESGVSIATRLVHSSGEWIESDPLRLPVDARHAQAVGSAITYGRRYSLSALLGIATEDDDGGGTATNNAQSKTPSPQRETPKNNNDPVRTQAINAVKEYAGVQPEDAPAAIKSVCKAAGIDISNNRQLTDDEWQTVKDFVAKKSAEGVGFEDATATQVGKE